MAHSDPSAELDYDRRPLGSMTVEFAISARYELCVDCDTCRVIRPVNLLALAVAGRDKQEIRTLKFRCHKCGARGVPRLSGWEDGGRTSYS